MNREFLPQLRQIVRAYEYHQLDYLSAFAQIEALRQQGIDVLRQLGSSDGGWARIEADNALRHINQLEQQRRLRGESSFPAAEFGGGGFIPGGFERAVSIRAHSGEAILNRIQQQIVGPERIARAFRATGAARRGGSAAGGFQEGGFVSASGGLAGEIHLHFHGLLIDEEGVRRAVREMWPEIVRNARRAGRSQGLAPAF